MKKVVSLLLVISMFLAFACACDKDDPTIDTKNSSSTKEGRLLKKYIDINKTGRYIIETKLPGENPFPTTITVMNKDKKMLTLSLESKENKIPMSLIINKGQKFLVLSGINIYAKLDDSQLKYYFDQLELASNMQLGKMSFVEDGKVTIEGKDYKYEDYMNPQTHVTSRFVFNNKELVMTGDVHDKTVSNYMNFNLSGDVTEEMFDIPEEYKENKEEIDKLVAMMDKELTSQTKK